MITVPNLPLALEAFRASHVVSSQIHVYKGDKLVIGADHPLIVSGGSVTVDREQNARRTLSCTVPMSQWHDIPNLDVIDTRLKVYIGYDLGAEHVLFPVGVFRVDTISRSSSGELTINGSSLESYVIDYSELDESEWGMQGDKCLKSIKDLISVAFPSASPPVFDITADAQAESSVTLPYNLPSGERWSLVRSYGFTISCDVYCNVDGEFRISKYVDLSTRKPVWRINEGSDGVLISADTSVTRDSTYNAVKVISYVSGSDEPTATGSRITVADLPNHPMQGVMDWDGPFGKKLRVVKDETGSITTKAGCNAKAKALLLEELALERTLDLSAIPNPALEPDDVIEIVRIDPVSGEKLVESHLLVQMTIPLGLGEWTASTLSSRSKSDLDLVSPIAPENDN